MLHFYGQQLWNGKNRLTRISVVQHTTSTHFSTYAVNNYQKAWNYHMSLSFVFYRTNTAPHFLSLSRRACERSADLAVITKQTVGSNWLQLDEKMTPYLQTRLLDFCDIVNPSYRGISLQQHLFLSHCEYTYILYKMSTWPKK